MEENLDEGLKSINELLKNNHDATNVPHGLPGFLSSVYDKAKKLAVPIILGGGSIAAIAMTGGGAIPVVGVVGSSIGLGNTMLKIYRNSSKLEDKQETSYHNSSLENQLIKFGDMQEKIVTDLSKISFLACSERKSMDNKLQEMGRVVLNKIDTGFKKLLDKDDEDIEIAFATLEKKLIKNHFTSAKELLHNLNFDEMYIKSNTPPEKAEQKIFKALNEKGKEAAIHEYEKLLGIRQKLEAMKQLKYFFKDVECSRMINMEDYCRRPGQEFLEELECYWHIIKQAFKHEWKIPKVLILGKTGTGKSTLCNILAGKAPECDLMSGGFPVSDGVDSCTKETTFGDYCYLGNSSQPVTIIDTPGFDDPSKNQDAEIISNLVETLSENFGGIHQILIAVNGTNPRLDGSMKAMIDIFQRMFTDKIWENIGIVFTKISMDKSSVRKREKQRKNYDQHFAEEYVAGLKREFHYKGNRKLDTFFIDSYYDEEDEKEKEGFYKEVENLWTSINQKTEFPTDYVQKVLTEFDSLKKELEKRELDLLDQNRRVRELEEKELDRLILDMEEARKPEQGFTFCHVKSVDKHKDKILNYHEYVTEISPKSNPFGKDDLDVEIWRKVKEQTEPSNEGFTYTPYISSEKILGAIFDKPIVFVLEIHNITKYFMNGDDFSGGDVLSSKPAFMWHPKRIDLSELVKFNSFVIPPFTTERIIFTKEALLFAKLKAVLTFSLGNYPPTTSVKKVMIMFQVAGRGKNSYAVGFPNLTFNNTEMKDVLQTSNTSSVYFSKGFSSKEARKDVANEVSKVFWPPEDKKVPGDFEVSFSCGNRRKCIGTVILKKTPVSKIESTSNKTNA